MYKKGVHLAKTFTIVCGVGTYSAHDAKSQDLPIPDDCKLYQVGISSWYGEELRGSLMKNEEPFNPDLNTVAHLKLPMDTKIAIVPKVNGEFIQKAAMAVVTDRGPRKDTGRVLDVSKAIASQLNFVAKGTQQVGIFICP